MKFSIIIPTLNEEKLLNGILDQLCSADLKAKYDYEVIISDGGSTDDTHNIALQKADKLIVHNENTRQNISQGRNAGSTLAKGEWLIFMNGDVLISDVDQFFTKLLKFCYSSNFLGLTFAVKVLPNENRIIDKIFLSAYNYYFHFLNLIGLGMGRGECMVISKKLFDELHGFNENLFAGEDFELFTRVRKKGKIKFIHNPIIYESPRRYRKLGHFRILFTWLANSISVFINKKSISTEWEEVR